MDRDLTRHAVAPRLSPRARDEKKKKRPQMSRLSPFVLNDLFLSLLSLECPFCPVLCPSCPSNKRLKFAEIVLLLLRSQTVNMAKHLCRDCPIPNCGAKYLVKLSNHLTDEHDLDYINRRKWLQEAKLQPKVRVMIYIAKRSQGLRRSRNQTQCRKRKRIESSISYQHHEE